MTYREVLPIWWSLFWRMTLVGAIAGFVAGFIAGFIAGALGYPGSGPLWGAIAGTLVYLPVSIWALRAAINKHDLTHSPTQPKIFA